MDDLGGSPVLDEEFRSKRAATKHLAGLGYPKHLFTTESGDYGYGSREYYTKADGQGRASVSKVAGAWFISILD